MIELVLETSRVPTSSPLRPGGRETALIRAGTNSMEVHLFGVLRRKMQQRVEQGGTLAGWVAEAGQASKSRAVESDAEAFLPAFHVTELQVDVCANALQGL